MSSSTDHLMSNAFLRDSMLQLSIPTRDPVYYIQDGNTILLVGNTLFKVHRSTLTKDKSMFEGMFSLVTEADPSKPSVSVAQEGETDDSPIRLQGDTSNEFRALLWALYALPHELMAAMTPDANCVQLFDLARISHKYQFRSLESWALGALHAFYSRPGAFDVLPSSTHEGSGPSLIALTELAALCERRDILEAVTSRWLRQLRDGGDIALAISVAERLNIRPLLGAAYHAMLLKGREQWETEPLLSRQQRVRLLSGHYALTRLCDDIPTNAPVLTHSPRCTAAPKCGKAWVTLWRGVLDMGAQMISHQRVDVLGRLTLAETVVKAIVDGSIAEHSLMEGMPHCKENALLATQAKLREVKENLADYFTDVQ